MARKGKAKKRPKRKAKAKGGLRSWKTYHKKWGQAIDNTFRTANSLSKKTPYGKDGRTGKHLKSAQQFAKTLHRYDDQIDRYKRLTKRAYRRQTGKTW